MLPVVSWLFLAAYAAAESYYTLELTWTKGSPDGFERDMILINGQFPGPHIELEQGDWAEITVINKMPFNTTIHSHGIHQTNTPWADGVPGLSQRPIQPNDTFTYNWHADTYGSYFYHAHSRGQLDDGCYGPITIKPKAHVAKPFDKIALDDVASLEAAEAHATPLIISDWRHKTSSESWELELAAGLESAVCVDSLLVNGKGAVDCWPREDLTKYTSPALVPLLQQTNLSVTDKGCIPPEVLAVMLPSPDTNITALPPSAFDVCTPTRGSREVIRAPCSKKWMALDIISSASIGTYAVSIDKHPLWVYAVDGHYIEPLKVDALTLANGERYSVFVQLDKPASNYGIRIASLALAQLIDTTAVLSYEDTEQSYGNGSITPSSEPSINRAGGNATSDVVFFDQAKMVSFPPQFPQPAPEAEQTFLFSLVTAGSSFRWALNGTAYDHAIDDSEPPLMYRDPLAITTPGNLTLATKNNTWVDLIFHVATVGQPPHPLHKHSNKAFLIGQGQGNFTWSSVAEAAADTPENFNLITPPYRDGFVTPPSATGPTWLAVRYHVVNPGPFLLHCHIQSHLDGGMSMIILDGVDEWPEVPKKYMN
ncbi:multicopper oxidase [Paraphaeosphaeria sporulosa]